MKPIYSCVLLIRARTVLLVTAQIRLLGSWKDQGNTSPVFMSQQDDVRVARVPFR